jgi:hypothetical protein
MLPEKSVECSIYLYRLLKNWTANGHWVGHKMGKNGGKRKAVPDLEFI